MPNDIGGPSPGRCSAQGICCEGRICDVALTEKKVWILAGAFEIAGSTEREVVDAANTMAIGEQGIRKLTANESGNPCYEVVHVPDRDGRCVSLMGLVESHCMQM